jgi:hypothetical protein
MQNKFIVTTLIMVLITLAGCATYKTTLTNAQGQTVTCEASGKSGIVTGYYLRRGFEDCIAAAKAQGYTEGTQSKQSSGQAENSPKPAINTSTPK